MKFSLILILSVLSVSLLITGCFANNGQCTFARSRKSSSTVYRQAYNTVQDSTRYACGFLWLWRCTRYSRRYVYYRASSVHYYTSYYSVTECCSGYASINGQCRPHCSQGCSHGSCTSPGVCSCSSGWTGSSCSDDIVECSSNNGGCAQHCSNSEGSYSCYCSNGYNLASDGHSCVDINECNTNNGGCSHSCTNNQGSYTCSCPNGYHVGNNGHTCVDTNECLNNNGGCSDNCNNSPGSYSCSCNSNYYLTTNKHTCLDINECTNGAVGIGINNGTNWCEQLCVNTPGSYRCDCHPGYRLNSDNKTCSDINECLDNNGDCSQTCTNTPGSHICSCQSGYILLEDKTSCTDHCECCTGADDCQHVCHNTAGSYYCTCLSGYRVSAANSSACEDINECSDGSSGCDQVCVNEIGGYNCSCLGGYNLLPNGHSCEDINECNNSNGGCEHSCINTPGSHYCECQSGYYISTNNRSCLDINECITNASNCSQVCVNNVGSYSCSCHQGYIINSNGATCDDVDECSDGNGGCQHSCINTVGSFICQCHPGYRIHTNGYSCVDINECTSNTSNCSQVCINSIGGFSCDCFVGYNLNTNRASCDDINECLSDNGGCQQICINTVGSYDCQCHQGYSKNASSCIALDCPVIAAPMNGHMSCSGEQVTDQNCTFWCDPGYNISGSSFRTCLGSNQSWSGKDTSCSKSQCPPLASTESTFVVYPCSNEYLDYCELYCEKGYINDNREIIWSQICNVTEAKSEAVDWYPNQTCKGRNLCEPNPCMPGTCSLEEDAIKCDCSDTYYTGERCQLGYAVAQPVPPLVKGSSEEVTLTSKPLIQTMVSITASDNSSLGINKQMISLSPQSSSGSYTVQANKSGLYTISYDAISGSFYIKPDNTLILVTERSHGQEPDYFASQGLQSGHLEVGCCSKQLTLSPEQCFSNLTLHSYCQWNQMDSSSDGVVHLSIASLYLPVSIAGVKVLRSLPLSVDTHYSTDQCLTCDKAPNQHCHTPSQIMDYNSNTIQTILQHKSLSVSLFSSIKNFLPSWLKIEVHSSASSSYSVYDFTTFIGTAKEVKKLPGCDKIELADTSALLYTHRTTSILLVTIDSHPAFYHALPVSPLCTIIDACSGLAPTLKLAIPPSLVSKNNAASISALNLFIAGNAQVNFQSISLQEDGIIGPELQEQLVYWNGKDHFKPTLPTHYQYKLNIDFQRTFTGQNLQTDVKFEGSVYYQPNATIEEVPGLLVGKMSLNVTTVINQRSVNLMLTSDEYPAIFTYPIEGASYENLPVGLSAILKYNEELTDSFYRDHFSIPQSVADCQILTFLSFDESLNINNVSFTTDCFTLSLGSLHFQEGLRHNILLPGSTAQDPFVSLIITSYQLSDSPYKFGRFSFFNTNNGPVLKVMYSSSITKMRGTLYSVNISLLNSHSLSNVSIANNQMTFQAQAKVFTNYDTRLIGSLATNNSMNIELNGEFIGTFRSDVSSYISQHLQNELNDVIKRSNSAIESVEISEKWRDELYLQLTHNNDKLLQEEKQLKEDNKSLIELKANTNDALNNLTIALESHIVNNDTLSVNELLCNNIDACNNECNPRLSCQPYNNNITFSVPGSCNGYELTSHIVRRVKVVLMEDWQEQIQCQSCWKTQWHKFLYFSQTQCCNKIKVRVPDMNRYKIQYVNSTANESTLQPCIVNNNTQLYDVLNCREENSCYHQMTNASCFTDLAGCLQELGESFATINSAISQQYSTYLNALLKEEEMKLIVARKDAKIYRLRENSELLESLFLTANQSYHTNVKANESLFEETDALIPFVSSFDSQPVTEIDILEVTNISFQFMLTNYTPAILPIEISYSILDTGEEHSFVEMVNFLQPRELILRQLSGSVLESYVMLVRGTRRQKRDNHEAMAFTFSSSIKFHDTCLQIKGSNLYIKQILELLGQSFAEFNSTLSLINATMQPYTNNESQNSIPPIIATQYNLIKADVSKHSHSMIELLKNNSFASWQAQIEAIHSSIGPLELFGCSSYLDCIGSITNQLEDILEDTSNAVQELSQLRQIRDIILQVAYNKSLSYDEAYDALKQLLTVTESNVVIEQWCIEPPVITTHLPSSVSIEINSTTELSCIASSSLLYYWVKDNITIPGSNSNKLMLTNVGLEDEGEYWCVALNGAGSSASVPSIVNVIMKPILNLTLPSHAYVHEEDTRRFQLTCDAYGIPAPGWMWFYKESEAHNWTLVSNSSSNVLTFKDSGFDDEGIEGWYQCVAFNPAGDVTSTPVFLNVLSTITPTIQYTFVLMLSGAREEWVQPIIDSLVLETNISGLVTVGSLTVFGGNITSISFTIQNDNTTLFEGMGNPNNELDELATQMMSSVSQLEQDKESLSLLLQRTNQLTFSVEDSTQRVSLIDYTIGPRTFTCSEEYQLDSDHLTCVACRPGSYGQVYMRSFVESEIVGEYIEELVPQCLQCPVGTYQENEGQSDCVSCSANYSTSRTGSVSVSDCKELCSPHHFSPTGLEPCSPCPPLTYQEYIGQRKCFPCGNDTMFDVCAKPVSTTSIIKATNTDTSNTNIGSSKSSSHYHDTTEHPLHSTRSTLSSTHIKNSTTFFSKSPIPSAVGIEGKSNQFSTGAIIGIIVALVTVAILIIIFVVAIVITRRKKRALQLQETSINQPSYEVELKYNDYESHNPKNLEAESDDLKLKQDEGTASLHIDELHIYDELPPPLEEITEETIKELSPPPLPPANNPYSSIIIDDHDDIMEKKSLKVADFYSSSDEEY